MNKKEFMGLLRTGEGYFIEFKESFDPKSISKEFVAFANSSGGKIMLGVQDSGEAKGIKITNKLKSQIQDLADNCDPKIEINFEEFEDFLIININEGKNKPYSCSSGFYLRVGANSQKMERDEILALAKEEGKINFDEEICRNFDWKDFDEEKFKNYLSLAKISDNLERDDILRSLKILTLDGLTNAGILFFAKSPSKYIKSSVVRCVHFNDSNRVDILDKKEFDKGIIGNIEFAFDYIKERVPVKFEIKTLKRKEFPEYPEDTYRELIVNSIVHRDYSIVGPDVSIEKLKDKIFISNPGGLLKSFPKGMFGKISWPRNKLIADLLSRTYLMEKVGTGIRRVMDLCKNNGNNLEIFKEENYYTVELFSNDKKTVEKTVEKIIGLIEGNSKITQNQIAKLTGLTMRGVEWNLKNLREKGLIERIGGAKGGHWKVNEK